MRFVKTCQQSVLTQVNSFNIHLEDVETKAQRGKVTCPESQGKYVA